MIIHLRKSRLFTTEPALRFAKEFSVSADVWREMWRRHKLLDYTSTDLCDYLELKTGRKTSTKTINRWVFRTEIYSKANCVMKKGATTVVSEFFGEYEQDLINELTRGMRFSGKQNSRIIV